MTNDTNRPFKFLRDKFDDQSRLAGEKILDDQHKGPRNLLATTHIGNEHIAIPAFLIADPILEPVDKAVYNAIRLVTPKQLAGETASYPSYKDICRVANISSDATVSRALIILRLMRWISQRTLSAITGVMGNVYITHDHPVDFEMYTELNNNYDEFLRSSLNHNHARVRAVAEIVIESYENDLVKTGGPKHSLEHVSISSDYLQGNKDSDYFSISSKSIDTLNSSSNIKERNLPSSLNIKEPKISSSSNIKEQSTLNIKEPVKTPSLNIKEPDLPSSLNIEELSSSSSYLKTTTTKAGNLHFANKSDDKLISEIAERFPNMDTGQHNQMGRILMRVELEDDRYSVIYELANRLKFGESTIHNPLGYLGSLIAMLNRGEIPFSSYAVKDYKPIQTDKPKEKQKTVAQEINAIGSEISSVANEISTLEVMQKQSPNAYFEKQLSEYKQQAKTLSEKRALLNEQNLRH